MRDQRAFESRTSRTSACVANGRLQRAAPSRRAASGGMRCGQRRELMRPARPARPASAMRCAPRPVRASSAARVSRSRAMSKRDVVGAPARSRRRARAQFSVVSKRGAKPALPQRAHSARATPHQLRIRHQHDRARGMQRRAPRSACDARHQAACGIAPQGVRGVAVRGVEGLREPWHRMAGYRGDRPAAQACGHLVSVTMTCTLAAPKLPAQQGPIHGQRTHQTHLRLHPSKPTCSSPASPCWSTTGPNGAAPAR